MKKLGLSILIILLLISFVYLSGQNMNKVCKLISIISINDFPVIDKKYIPFEFKIFPDNGYILYSFHNDEDFSKQMVKIERFNNNKEIEGTFIIANPTLYAKKLELSSIVFDFINFVNSKLILYDYFGNSITEYNNKFDLLVSYSLGKTFFPVIRQHNLEQQTKSVIQLNEKFKKRNFFPGEHFFFNTINSLFLDNKKNIYLFNTCTSNWDKEYEEQSSGEDQHSFFVKLKKEGNKYIEDTDFMLKFDGTQLWYPEELVEKYEKQSLCLESQTVGYANISVFTATYLDSFYYYNPGISVFVKTTLDADLIKKKELTENDNKKISEIAKKYDYENDEKLSFYTGYMHTLYVDEDENIYVVSLKDIVIYDKNFNPVDMICPGNLKELGENVFIDEIVKIEGNKMWLSIRRYTGEIFTSQEQDTREIWVVDIK